MGFDDDCKKEFCEIFEGNSVDVDLQKNDCEVRADIKVKKFKSVRIWGQVKDCDNKPVCGALVKLLMSDCKGKHDDFEGVAHTITDCLGYYQFEICPPRDDYKFRILVSKPAVGNERVLRHKENCDPCDDKDFFPCSED